MARSWEPEFIRRWEAGETTEQIAVALGIAEGTARSRAYTLQQEGTIRLMPRPGENSCFSRWLERSGTCDVG
jgi:DNA-directed RNA polymerase specialized sigma24 family protein